MSSWKKIFGKSNEDPTTVVGPGSGRELIKSAMAGDSETLNVLLQKGADVNSKDEGGNTALQLASLFGQAGTVKILLANGADVNATSDAGATALINASLSGNTETMVLLIQNGADVEAKTSSDNSTALMCAAMNGHAGCVRLLLQHNADIHAKTNDGRTALNCAEDGMKAKAILGMKGTGLQVTEQEITMVMSLLQGTARGEYGEIIDLLKVTMNEQERRNISGQPGGRRDAASSMRDVVWSVVDPLQTALQDPNKIIDLGPDSVPVVVDVFLHPKEPSTGIACNQAILACVLDVFARKGNQGAASFLRQVANDEVDLFDDGGQTAYEMAKAFVSDNPLAVADSDKSPVQGELICEGRGTSLAANAVVKSDDKNGGHVIGQGKASAAAPVTKSFQPTYPEWMVVPDNAGRINIDSDCEVLSWETFVCPKCSTRFGDLPSNGPGVKYVFDYGMRGIADGAPQSFAKVWWTEVRCCGQKYLVSNRGKQ